MVENVHLVKKGLLRTASRTINVADLVKRNEFERKQEKKYNLIFVTIAIFALATSLFVISL